MENKIKQELHKHKFRQRALEKVMVKLIEELKDDPTRPGLIETPYRAVGLISKYLDGQRYSNEEIIRMFDFAIDTNPATSENTSEVCIKGIRAVSVSEVSLIPYVLDVDISYIPNQRVIGTSKVHKLVDLCAKRLRIQENVAADIFSVLTSILGTEDISIKLCGHQIDGDVYTEHNYGVYRK